MNLRNKLKDGKLPIFLNLISISILAFLPYLLFEGKLFIGGDDTRLLYVFPYQFLKEWSFFSWSSVSSLSYFNPSFHYIPFLLLWSLADSIIRYKVVLDYFAFSLPLILGFIFFQLFVKELLQRAWSFELYIGALFYVFSPILMVNQYAVFLTPVWLISLFPAAGYLFLRYNRTGSRGYVWMCTVLCVFSSITLYTFAWIFGLLIPVTLTVFLALRFYPKRNIFILIRRSFFFFFSILCSQLFWVIPFFYTFVTLSGGNLGSNVISKETINTFSPTVLSTATGSVLYPFLNLFHRQIALDFDWPLEEVFKTYYDQTAYLNLLYIIIILVGIALSSKVLQHEHNKIHIFSFVSLLISLFLFTVNIGPLRELFLLFGNIPGFVMFRNFYDKFAPGYVFIYAVVFTISLIVVSTRYKKYRFVISTILILLIMLNTYPIKQVVSSPIWKTKDIYKNVTLPNEYLEFLQRISRKIPSTETILSLPFNEASYAVVMDDDRKHAYVGTSPIKILTGVNDVSGSLSFPPSISSKIGESIYSRRYDILNKILEEHHINYVMVTRNIPDQVLRSFFFDYEKVKLQDPRFISSLVGAEILRSQRGNFLLYNAKKQTDLFSPQKVTYNKISPTKYELTFHNLKSKESLVFLDSFHPGWKLFLKDDGAPATRSMFSQGIELSYLWKSSLFTQSHKLYKNFGNEWLVDKEVLKNENNRTKYKENPDGSITVNFILYFVPQAFFYLGLWLSSISVLVLTLLCVSPLLYKRYGKKKIR